jgi:enoyl-CoA hydratase
MSPARWARRYWQAAPRRAPSHQRISAEEAHAWRLVEEVAGPGTAFDAAMALAAKFASQPPISAAMTKLTVNRLTHALDDLTSHMDIDQFAFATLTRGSQRGRGGVSGSGASRISGDVDRRRLAHADP